MDERQNRRDDEFGADSTAARVEEWLRSLRAQRSANAESAGRSGRGAAPSTADETAEAFLKAARRLAGSPRAQQALARRLAEAGQPADDPSLHALARLLESLGRELSKVRGSAGSGSGTGAAVLERPDIIEERRLSDDGGGGGDDVYDDDDGGGGGGDDEEPWPSAFIGYRVGIVESIDVGSCRDGCCTAVFIDHPGLRAAVWFPTESAAAFANSLGEWLHAYRGRGQDGEVAELGVPPFGAGKPPARGHVQAAIQFFTEDIHLDLVEDGPERQVGAFARFVAYDQGLGHGGPPLVDALIDVAQARALRRGLRRVARQFSKEE